MVKRLSKNKSAAMEMSMSTIVILVLAVSMLILGLVLIKKIMCSGVIMTDQISTGVQKEIQDLFANQEYGVKCEGEGGQDITLGDGGRRKIVCFINEDTAGTYTLKVTNIESIKGVSKTIMEKWAIDKDWTGSVKPGSKEVNVLTLDIPRDVSESTMKITLTSQKEGGDLETHTMILDISHVGTMKAAVCKI
jgi:hypothetical protein